MRLTQIISLLASGLFALCSAAQNLVPNPGFDTVVNCQTGILLPGSTISDAEGWISPSQASADHFNACHTTFSLNLSEPANFMGNQDPLSDDSYAGLITYEDTSLTSNYREYIQIQLSEPLQQDTEYSIGFHCSLAEDALYASDGLGMYISSDQVSEPSQYIMNQSPQLVADVVAEEDNWVQIHGTYLASGGESYVTLGCFTDDTNVTLQDTGTGFFVRAYYYIDDVYVIDSSSTVSVDAPDLKGLSLFPIPVEDKLTISFGSLQSATDVTILDLAGNVKLSELSLSGLSKELDVSTLPNGVYFAIIQNANTRKVVRVVKE